MDIARIRKKLKKTDTPDKPEPARIEKAGEASGDKRDVYAAPKAEKNAEAFDVSADKAQRPIEKPAEAVVAAVPEAEAAINYIDIIAFSLANEEYAVNMCDLQEVMKYQSTTAVPRVPKFLKGITSVRGKILPVIDMSERLGLDEETDIKKRKIIVISGDKEPIGILVGSILGVFRFAEKELLPPPNTLTESEKNLIGGIVKINNRFISILKVDEILRMV